MNFLHLLWTSAQSAFQSISRSANQREQHAVEAYLSKSQSVAELEFRERQLMRARD